MNGPNPSGLCQCGCGGITSVAKSTVQRYGHVRGEHTRFILNHHHRKFPMPYVIQDRGYLTACWVWQGAQDKYGYGNLNAQGRHIGAHRYYYEQAKGPIPAGLHLDHLCRNPSCVNPDHLEPVTPRENVRRGLAGQRTVCRRGHNMSDDNVYIAPDGRRRCRACRQASARRAEKNRRRR